MTIEIEDGDALDIGGQRSFTCKVVGRDGSPSRPRFHTGAARWATAPYLSNELCDCASLGCEHFRDRDGDVIEIAEAHDTVAFGMLPGSTHQRKGGPAAQPMFSTQHGGPCRELRHRGRESARIPDWRN